MNNSNRFKSISAGTLPPRTAHPGYDNKEASVEIMDKAQTLHFLKEEDGFCVTLYYHPTEDGSAPAISLGFVSGDKVSQAIREEVLSIDGRRFDLGSTRLLRRIL